MGGKKIGTFGDLEVKEQRSKKEIWGHANKKRSKILEGIQCLPT